MPLLWLLWLGRFCCSVTALRLIKSQQEGRVHKIHSGADNADRIALFAVASDNPEYLKKVIVTFQLAKQMNRDMRVDTIIFGPFDNPKSRNMLKDAGLDMHYLDVEGYDKSCNHQGCWPGVMHWWSAVPEVLADMGYKYSVFIDGGDVIAYRPVTMLAVKHALQGGSLSYKVTSLGQVNSGIIVFDNMKCKEQGLATEYLDFYQRHKNDTTIKDKNGEKDLAFSLNGRRGDSDYLRLLIRSIESPKQIEFRKMVDTTFGMICRRGVANPIPQKWPYFVHLSNCHKHIPEADQKGIPLKAYYMWANKSQEIWGEVLSFDNKNSGETEVKFKVKPASVIETEEEKEEAIKEEMEADQDVSSHDF